jgi:uncharacterized repeat protein (TIGR03803 family)
LARLRIWSDVFANVIFQYPEVNLMILNIRRFLILLSATMALGLFAGGKAYAVGSDTLYSFCSDFESPICLDGDSPTSRLLQIGDEFYGTNSVGTLAKFQYKATSKAGYGNVFKVSTTGSFAAVYDFCQQTNCSDGASPGNYLTRGKDNLIYGVTLQGGKAGAGTVFTLSAQGKLTTLYRFCSKANCVDGVQPVSVVFDAGGVLFGTAAGGGSHGGGIAFTLGSGGVLHVLHNFCSADNCTDGVTPGPMIRGKDGNFYGTTAAGGTHQSGTVFRMTPTGVLTTLYSLCLQKQCSDGEQPIGLLTQGTDGNFYGATVLGGVNRAGTVFRMTPTGAWDVLYAFCNQAYCDDGSTPQDGLIEAKDGSFYGTASAGGRYYHGVVFNLTTAGKYSILHGFCSVAGCFDGASPEAAPTLGTDGSLYGTTFTGGAKYNVGAVYRIKP